MIVIVVFSENFQFDTKIIIPTDYFFKELYYAALI